MTLTETNTTTDTDNETDEDWAMRDPGRQRHDRRRVGLLHGRATWTRPSYDIERLRARELQRHLRLAQRHGDGERLGLVVEPVDQTFGDVLGTGGAIASGSLSYTVDTADTDELTKTEDGTETIADELVGRPEPDRLVHRRHDDRR